MIKVEIDGKTIETEKGARIIDVADDNGIQIPRFCYHRKLSAPANCRMCLVEVIGGRKPVPACITECTDGMKVQTQSDMAIRAQKAVMEFLLINHPLDCPICDQGGQCELQDVAMGYGKDVSRYCEGKRAVEDENIGPLVATEMTRCIHCTRCVRYGNEIAGMRELGATGRTEHMRIGTYVKHSMRSEVAGNIIDLCPVGALLSKPFLFKARAWELEQHKIVSPHDCWGTNAYAHTLSNKVMRVVPRDNEEINETWIADRDRFSYEGLYSEQRLTEPMIKKAGVWQVVDWQEALTFAASALQGIAAKQGPESIALFMSPNMTSEEYYLAQKWFRGLGSNNIDHRLRQTDFSDQADFPAYPHLGITIADIEKQDAVLLIGSYVRHEQPMASLRLRKAALKQTKIFAINSVDYDFNFPLAGKIIASPQELLNELASVALALKADYQEELPQGVDALLKDAIVSPRHEILAAQLKAAKHSAIMLGLSLQSHHDASRLRALSHLVAILSHSSLGCLTEGGNAAGAWLAGAVPHRLPGAEPLMHPGKSVKDLVEQPCKAYVLCDVDPAYDFYHSAQMMNACKQAECVIGITAFASDKLKELADVLLPAAPFTEVSGTYVNVEGNWQNVRAATKPYGNSRPAWKIFRVLGNLTGLEGFEFSNVVEVAEELQAAILHKSLSKKWKWSAPKAKEVSIKMSANALFRVTEFPLYRLDNLVRCSKPLQEQQSVYENSYALRVHPNTAALHGLVGGQRVLVKQGSFQQKLPVAIEPHVAENTVYIACAFDETADLGPLSGEVEIQSR